MILTLRENGLDVLYDGFTARIDDRGNLSGVSVLQMAYPFAVYRALGLIPNERWAMILGIKCHSILVDQEVFTYRDMLQVIFRNKGIEPELYRAAERNEVLKFEPFQWWIRLGKRVPIVFYI